MKLDDSLHRRSSNNSAMRSISPFVFQQNLSQRNFRISASVLNGPSILLRVFMLHMSLRKCGKLITRRDHCQTFEVSTFLIGSRPDLMLVRYSDVVISACI